MTRSLTIWRNMHGDKASPVVSAPYDGDIPGTAVALKSGNDRFEDIIQSFFQISKSHRPFFDIYTSTIYAAVLRSVLAYANSSERDGIYGSAETFAPRSGFASPKTAAQLFAHAVKISDTSSWGTASVSSNPARRPGNTTGAVQNLGLNNQSGNTVITGCGERTAPLQPCQPNYLKI